MTIRGWDESWGKASPALAKRLGFKVVSMYLSHDPSKNATPELVKGYHDEDIAVEFNWESSSGRPLLGGAAGTLDATDAGTQLDQLKAEFKRRYGYLHKNQLNIPFSCDTEVHGGWANIDSYYRNCGVVLHGRYGVGCYGDADLVDHLHRMGLTVMNWQTLAWSYGRVSPEADFYQFGFNKHIGGADVDWDSVIHPQALGAWWPPGSQYDVDPEGFVMDAEAKAAFAHVGAQVAALQAAVAKVYDMFKVSDGENSGLHHGLEAQLAVKLNGQHFTDGKGNVRIAETTHAHGSDIAGQVARIAKKVGA